jgi:hypothetical protein
MKQGQRQAHDGQDYRGNQEKFHGLHTLAVRASSIIQLLQGRSVMPEAPGSSMRRDTQGAT